MPQQNQGFSIDTLQNANMDLQALAGVQLGGPTVWGVAPTGEEVQGVNACIAGVGISTYGSPAQTGLNVFVLNPLTIANNVDVTVTNVPEVTITNPCLNVCGLTFTEVGSPAVSNLNVVDETAATYLDEIAAALAAVTGTAGSPAVPVINVNVVSEAGSGTCVTQCTVPWIDNVTEWASTTLGAPTAWGTAPTGNVIGVNADLFAGGVGLTTTTAGSPAVPSLNVFVTGTDVATSGGYQYLNGTTPGSVYGTAALGIDVNGEVHVLNTDTYGNQEFTPAAPATSQFSFVVINVAVGAGAGNQVIIAVPCRIFEMDLQVSGLGAASSTITFKDGATALTGPYFALNGWSWSRENNGDYAFKCATNFTINNSTAAQLSGYVKYQ